MSRNNDSTQAGSNNVAAVFANVGDRFVVGPRRLVRPLGNQRVEHVGKRDDARVQRDFFAAQSIRVTAAIPAFVMAQGHLRTELDELALAVAQYFESDMRMPAA